MSRIQLLVITLAIVTLAIFSNALSSSLHVDLKSTWIETSKIAEVAEFLSHRTNESLYWSFIERSSEIKDEQGLDVAKDLLDESTFSLLKMSLDLRYYSPRVQFQISKSPNQQTTIQTHDSPVDPLIDDHVYRGSNDIYSIVYADLKDAEDRVFVSEFVRNKRSSDESFILRYISKEKIQNEPNKYMQRDSPLQKKLLNLRAYGVEIALKNMEYKQTESEAAPSSFGINFDKLKKQYPHLSTDFDTFRDHMQKEAPASKQKELKVWEMSNLGIQATHEILNNKTHSLETIQDLAQNFPAHIFSLVRVKYPSEFKTSISHFQSKYGGFLEARNPNNPQETIRKNALYVNGIETDLTKLSAFSLYDLVVKESQFVNRFTKWDLGSETIQKLIYNTENSGPDEHPRFYIPDELMGHIVWLNDVDNDDRYSYNFPRDLHSLLQPTFFGQMRFVRRNIITSIVVFNPLNDDHINKIIELTQIINRGYPIRVGLLPRSDESERSVELCARFEHLNQIRGPISATQYLFGLQNKGGDLDYIKNSYNNYRGGMRAIDVARPERIRMETRRKLIEEQLGLSDATFVLFVNGVLFNAGSDSGDQILMNALRYEYDKVLDLVRGGKINDDMNDLHSEIIKANKHYTRYNPLIFSEGRYEIVEAPKGEYLGDGDHKPTTHILCVDKSNATFSNSLVESAKAHVSKHDSIRIALLDASDDFCKKYFKNSGIIATTGRIIDLDRAFSIDDWQLLEEFEKGVVGSILSPDDLGHKKALYSDAVFNLNTVLVSFQKSFGSRSLVDLENDATKLEFNKDSSLPMITVILNPLSLDAQRLTPLLRWLVNYGYPITIHLNPLLESSNLPLKTYYRYVLNDDMARFDNLTARNGEIYTLRMDVPETWLVESIYAEQDLDNLNLYSDCSTEACYARFQLEHLVVTGTCFDKTHRRAPRGLQLELIDHSGNGTAHDVTLVMANLGYFQLKAEPGLYDLELPKGRHSDIYSIESVAQVPFYYQGQQEKPSTELHQVVVNDFDAPFATVIVRRNPGKENEELLQYEEEEEGKSIWSTVFRRKDDDKEKVIHIFSLASGHMYERLLKIMTRSVTTHIKRPNTVVKFWFLKQFLSPGFKQLLPYLAEHFGFRYGFVSYQWPHWLHKQEQKQRLIWAYKVLFLDVLFPLREVQKIIFVDADQICRTDMSELFFDLDMEGKSLAYTPFCDSRKEMAGFQFWKQGYWSQHLRGLPYHISALYVVDVAKFRKEYHGDQFRMYYDNLARDPNSLSNLDQDLPNYAQHVVPIRSLPQEWLWCETWCSDESKARAKTIDLCNNPQTKEHKLASARRIIPEWTTYDEEIKAFEKTLGNITHV